MKIPKWLLVTVVLIAVVAIAEFVMLLRLDGAVEDEKIKVKRLTDDMASLSFDDRSASKTDKDKEPVSGQEDRLKALELKVTALQQRVDSFSPGENPDVDLEELVDRKLGEKWMAAVGAVRGRMRAKASLSVIAKNIGMSEGQKEQVSESVKQARQEIIELASTANSENLPLVKDVNKILKSRLPPLRKKEGIRRKLASANPPGSEESYLERMISIRNQVIADFQQTLTEEQFDKFKAMHISPFAIRVEN